MTEEGAALWLEGYNRQFELIPNTEIDGLYYVDTMDPEREEERFLSLGECNDWQCPISSNSTVLVFA